MLHHRQLHLGQEVPQPPVHQMTSTNPSEKSFASRNDNDYYGVPYRIQANGSRFKSQPTSPLESLNIVEEFSKGDLASHYGYVDRGSSLSLQSQERQTDIEIQKLRKELATEHEKVINLSSQLVSSNEINYFKKLFALGNSDHVYLSGIVILTCLGTCALTLFRYQAGLNHFNMFPCCVAHRR